MKPKRRGRLTIFACAVSRRYEALPDARASVRIGRRSEYFCQQGVGAPVCLLVLASDEESER